MFCIKKKLTIKSRNGQVIYYILCIIIYNV